MIDSIRELAGRDVNIPHNIRAVTFPQLVTGAVKCNRVKRQRRLYAIDD
jgi:hypothetical protein